MSGLVRLATDTLKVGKPLPFAVYDKHGNLLLNQGHVIQNEEQLERLYKRGLLRPRTASAMGHEEGAAARGLSPFAEYSGLLYELEAVLAAFTQLEETAPQRLERLARQIDTLCHQDPDACLALIHVYSVEPTAYEQTLFYAILCRFIGVRLGLTGPALVTLLAAALTANIALLPYLDKLNNSRNSLAPEQRAVINRHPLLSANALRQAGVEDETWLRIVEQHHEHFDGSGYPVGLSGPDLLREAKILSLAERYVAMTAKRAYRKRWRVDQAIADILASMRADPNPEICQALLQELTLYPPGVLVQLANKEIAVVTHRRRQGAPKVQAIINAAGNPYMGALYRDSQLDDFAITRVVVPDVLPALNLALLWGYG